MKALTTGLVLPQLLQVVQPSSPFTLHIDVRDPQVLLHINPFATFLSQKGPTGIGGHVVS